MLRSMSPRIIRPLNIHNMNTEVIILECRLREGVAKATQKPYRFYAGKLLSPLGMLDFTADEDFKVGIDFATRKTEFLIVDLKNNDGKFSIKKPVGK